MLFTRASIFHAPSVQSVSKRTDHFDSGWQTFGRVHNLQIAYKAGKSCWLKIYMRASAPSVSWKDGCCRGKWKCLDLWGNGGKNHLKNSLFC